MIEPRHIKIVLVILFFLSIITSYFLIKSKRKEILLLVFSLCGTLILVEVLLQKFLPQIHEHNVMFEYDAVLGWKFIPSKTGAILYGKEANHNIRTNELGFRGGSLPFDSDEQRKILVLGDSFVSNLAVKEHEVFTEIIEDKLENTVVLNAGVNGYSQVQQYLLLKQIHEEFKPDLILSMIYLRNDFHENLGGFWLYPRPTVSWSSDESEMKIIPTPPNEEKQVKNSFFSVRNRLHSYALFDRILNHILNRINGAKKAEHEPGIHTPPEFYLCDKNISKNTKLMFKTAKALILKIKDFADSKKVPVGFVIAPSILQSQSNSWQSVLKETGEDDAKYDISLPNRVLIEFAQNNNIPILDLLPSLNSKHNEGHIQYNAFEQHWNKNGNLTVANEYIEFINSLDF